MAFDILCSDPKHADRSAEPGWSATLGTTTTNTDKRLICQACARLRKTEATEQITATSRRVEFDFDGNMTVYVLKTYDTGETVDTVTKTGHITDVISGAQALALRDGITSWWQAN